MKNGIYHCPVEVATEMVGGTWTAVVLAHLKESPRRFSELGRLIPDISEKMLTRRLRTLHADGLISRTEVEGGRPHVVYDLTEAGRSLAPALQALYDWGAEWAQRNELTIESIGV